MKAISQLISAYGQCQKQMITTNGHVLCGLNIEHGIELQPYEEATLRRLSQLYKSLYEQYSDTIYWQFYLHLEGYKYVPMPRDHSRSQLVSKRRAQFLNEKGLSLSKLFHCYEIKRPHRLELNLLRLRKLVKSMTSLREIKKIKPLFSLQDNLYLNNELLKDQLEQAEDMLHVLSDRLDAYSFNVQSMSTTDLWRLYHFLVNFDKNVFLQSTFNQAPSTHWHELLGQGDQEVVEIEGLGTALKLHGAVPVYIKVLSITGSGDSHVRSAAWLRGKIPLLQRGNYVVITRYEPYSRLQKSLFVKNKKNEVAQQTLKVSDILLGNVKNADERLRDDAAYNEDAKRAIQDLNRIQNDRIFGHYHASILVFDDDLNALRKTVKDFNQALNTADFNFIWESAGIQKAYAACLPGSKESKYRNLQYNAAQASALSLNYKSHTGLPHWQTTNVSEESLVILESADGTPFHFSPFVGDKCLLLCTGPIRSGKSFLRMLLAMHMLKFGTLYSAIDIDEGAIPLARFYGDDAAMINIGGDGFGFNPFRLLDDPVVKDTLYSHLVTQVRLMLLNNKTIREEERLLRPEELEDLIQCIGQVMSLGVEGRLSGVFEMLMNTTKQRLTAFLPGSHYGDLYGVAEDAIGELKKRISVFNLKQYKDNDELLPILMNEMFYRVYMQYENEHLRTIPKYTDIDEAHHLLSIEAARDALLKCVRTSGKYFGGFGLWTQGPREYMSIPDWHVVRGAATAYIFMPDSEGDASLYQQAFDLSADECALIKKMKPKKQALIVQREVGISKVVNINADPAQYVIGTSRPQEAPIRNELFKRYQHNPDLAIEETIKQLRQQGCRI
ncbi:hypothetical protein KCM76_20995 [Zooshikella marina]|uniref:VirB4 family type IV secretion system protein n=1 Tax=Zooshikella ganghwensis TaxID=202772 RepID=UPI001BB03758|nr:hypothetical protein [Zooshikella ganghwensis]MBU2708483.1 hypothetical protein [Zooshikella ganghwensis]